MTTTMGLYVVLGVLFLPLYVTLGGWIFGGPRDFRTAGIGFVYMAALTVFMISATVMMGIAFEILIYLGL